MKTKQKVLVTAVTAALSLGMVGDASADIYARSYMKFYNFTVAFGTLPVTGGAFVPGGAVTDNFTMSVAQTASLNGTTTQATDNICSGTPGSNNCNNAAPRLDAPAVNGIGGAPIRANNDFSFFGPGGSEYSNADSVIRTAVLNLDPTTETEQIAEAELQTGISARANAEIQSVTGLTFSFTVTGTNAMIITFSADSASLAQIDDLTALLATAQSNRRASLKLEKDGVGNDEEMTWSPDGVVGTGRTSNFGAFALEVDPFDLNGDFGATTVPCSNNGDPTPTNCPASPDPGKNSGNYQLIFTGLTDGDWTFTLNALTSVQLSRTPIPEPGTLALLGMGLAGLGFGARRRKQH